MIELEFTQEELEVRHQRLLEIGIEFSRHHLVIQEC